jgi:methylated-DNA-[protein]-cysteine S-methyltransferase
MVTDARIAEVVMALARARGPDKTICPSEAARALADEWRPLMPRIRRVVADLPLVATQGGVPVDPVAARGPIRLGLAAPAAETPSSLSIDTPFGTVRIEGDAGAVRRVTWDRRASSPATEGGPVAEPVRVAAGQLAEYCTGDRQRFDLPLALPPGGAARAVADAMLAIGYGRTRRYGEIASELGLSAQAVGQACGANALPILVPCHRVVGVRGLTGFSGAGGVETKAALLRHEGGLLL